MSVMMNVAEESRCGDLTRSRLRAKTAEQGSCRLVQVNVPGCISYDTFYKALEFTYCGEVDPASPVPHSPDSCSTKVSSVHGLRRVVS